MTDKNGDWDKRLREAVKDLEAKNIEVDVATYILQVLASLEGSICLKEIVSALIPCLEAIRDGGEKVLEAQKCSQEIQLRRLTEERSPLAIAFRACLREEVASS